ncbi:alpha/beta fold hydrolase [Aeromonas jandaei]
MNKKILTLVTCAIGLTACGSENKEASKPVAGRLLSAHYEPADICTDLIRSREKLPVDTKQISCSYFSAPMGKTIASGSYDQVNLFYVHYRSSAERLGTLFFHPGGPGETSSNFIDYLALLKDVDLDILKYYDVVTFDPRGTGYSALAHELRTCLLPDQSLVKPAMKPHDVKALFVNAIKNDQTPASAYYDYGKRDQELVLQRCGHIMKLYAPMFGTNTIVEDMETFRQFLNVDKITPIMTSYGPRVGAIYAYRYPERVADIILDSPMSPAVSSYLDVIRKDGSNMQKIIAWRFGNEANTMAERIGREIRDTNAFVDDKGESLNIESWIDILKRSVDERYTPSTLSFWHKNDQQENIPENDSDDINEDDTESNDDSSIESIMKSMSYTATHCADNSQPYSWSELKSFLEEPTFQGAGLYAFDRIFKDCADWPYNSDPVPELHANSIVLNAGAVALVLGGEFDNKTPYYGVDDMIAAFGSSARLVQVKQTIQHGQIGQASCADQELKTLLLGNKADIPKQQSCLPNTNSQLPTTSTSPVDDN